MSRFVVIAIIAFATTHAAHAQAPGCRADTECKGDRICNAGVCEAPKPAELSCGTDTDCSGALVCTAGKCTADIDVASHVFAPAPPPSPPPVATGYVATVSPPASFSSPPVAPSVSVVAPPSSPAIVQQPARREGWAGSVSALIGLQAWDNSGSPGGYPVQESNGTTYAFMQTSSVGGYVGHSDGADVALLLAQTVNNDGDGTYYGMVGLGLRGTGLETNNSFQASAGLAWTQYADGTTNVGLGLALQALLGPRSSSAGFAIASELDIAQASVGNDIIFTIGIGGAFSR